MLIMQSSSMTQASNAAFRALADQTRRASLKMLRDGPRTSGEIASRFDSSWPTISRHLAVLKAGGLVVSIRKGQEIYYELNTSVFQELAQHLMEWVTPPSKDVRQPRTRRRVPQGTGAVKWASE
jgi:ArsR family transcriptional regulator, arsenate/arsenite/antimonite-responsive transcriptional repressor